MPSICSVPNCNGNYRNGPRVAVFSFPKDFELRRKWTLAIKRDFEPTPYSRVCELHFTPGDILRESSMVDKDTGRTITAPLKYPRLKDGAIPSLMPNCPRYLSSEVLEREAPELRKERKDNDRLAQAINKSLREKAEHDAQRQFSSLEQLQSRIQYVTLPKNWFTIYKDNSILFLNILDDPVPVLKSSVSVNQELTATAYIEGVAFHHVGNKISLPMHVKDTNILSNIIDVVNNFAVDGYSNQHNLGLLKDIIMEMQSSMEDKETYLNFLGEQFSLLCTKKPLYSSDMLIFSTLLHTISPHAYRFVRSSGNILLPHPSTIHRVCAMSNFSPAEEQNADTYLKYISHQVKLLKDCDKTVNLLIDEIHIKPFCDYKGGNIVGVAYNDKKLATSAHVFMISSITSSYKDVVHILPVKTITYIDLHSLIINIILGLEKLGFSVICVVTDNNAINRKAMSQFVSPPSLNIVYPHPADKSRPLFYVTDTVHLLKCIRNNWLNQKNSEQCMYYPNFDNSCGDNTFQTASLSGLRKLVTCESNSLLKFGYSLSLKALSPLNLERQNVNLVLKVFNDFVMQALLELGPRYDIPNFSGTAAFIKIICTWWKIMNVKTPFKGIRLNDDYRYPLTSCEHDVKYLFLQQFLDWLDTWEKMNCSTGMLTRETHNALKRTTYAMSELASYCCSELGLSYILPGKFQTDHLESRFSLYRQLAGGQYHVSLRQIFESEKKLRFQTSIKLSMQTKSGSVNVTDFNVPTNFDEIVDAHDSCLNFPVVITDDDFDKASDKLPVIVYVGGYCVYSILKKLNCEECCSNLKVEKDHVKHNPAVQFTINLDRGQLIIPSPTVVNIVMYTYVVVSKLCNEFEDEFLKVKDHKAVAANLSINVLEADEICNVEFCSKQHDTVQIVKMIVWATVNILLNNYCKERNTPMDTKTKKKENCRCFQNNNFISSENVDKFMFICLQGF